MNKFKIDKLIKEVLAGNQKSIIGINKADFDDIIGKGVSSNALTIVSDKGLRDAFDQAREQLPGEQPEYMIVAITVNYEILMDEINAISDFMEGYPETILHWGLAINREMPAKYKVNIFYSPAKLTLWERVVNFVYNLWN